MTNNINIMNDLDTLREEFDKKESLQDFIKAYDKMCIKLGIEDIVNVIVKIIADLEVKEEKIIEMLNKIYPDEKNWKEIIDRKYSGSKVKNNDK